MHYAMRMFFGYGNPILLILVVGTFIFSMIAQSGVKSAYKKYTRIRNIRGLTGYEVARKILDANNLYHVGIEHAQGVLGDHYDPRSNIVRLSDGVYNGNSIASAAIAAHEVGHAIQYAESYSFIGMRNILLPSVMASSRFVGIIFMAGIFISYAGMSIGVMFMNVAILLFFLVAIFQTLTLPIEFDASKRGKEQLDSLHLIEEQEKHGVKKMLDAAAMTYVAALSVTLAELIRMIAIRNSHSD